MSLLSHLRISNWRHGFPQDFGIAASCHWIAKVAQKLGQRPCTIVKGVLSRMAMREFSIFITSSDAYTCTYVAQKF